MFLNFVASRSQISKSVPNASSDSDLTRYRTLLADRNSQRGGGERKSPSLSVATTAVEAAKIKVHLIKNRKKHIVHLAIGLTRMYRHLSRLVDFFRPNYYQE